MYRIREANLREKIEELNGVLNSPNISDAERLDASAKLQFYEEELEEKRKRSEHPWVQPYEEEEEEEEPRALKFCKIEENVASKGFSFAGSCSSDAHSQEPEPTLLCATRE